MHPLPMPPYPISLPTHHMMHTKWSTKMGHCQTISRIKLNFLYNIRFAIKAIFWQHCWENFIGGVRCKCKPFAENSSKIINQLYSTLPMHTTRLRNYQASTHCQVNMATCKMWVWDTTERMNYHRWSSHYCQWWDGNIDIWSTVQGVPALIYGVQYRVSQQKRQF